MNDACGFKSLPDTMNPYSRYEASYHEQNIYEEKDVKHVRCIKSLSQAINIIETNNYQLKLSSYIYILNNIRNINKPLCEILGDDFIYKVIADATTFDDLVITHHAMKLIYYMKNGDFVVLEAYKAMLPLDIIFNLCFSDLSREVQDVIVLFIILDPLFAIQNNIISAIHEFPLDVSPINSVVNANYISLLSYILKFFYDIKLGENDLFSIVYNKSIELLNNCENSLLCQNIAGALSILFSKTNDQRIICDFIGNHMEKLIKLYDNVEEKAQVEIIRLIIILSGQKCFEMKIMQEEPIYTWTCKLMTDIVAEKKPHLTDRDIKSMILINHFILNNIDYAMNLAGYRVGEECVIDRLLIFFDEAPFEDKKYVAEFLCAILHGVQSPAVFNFVYENNIISRMIELITMTDYDLDTKILVSIHIAISYIQSFSAIEIELLRKSITNLETIQELAEFISNDDSLNEYNGSEEELEDDENGPPNSMSKHDLSNIITNILDFLTPDNPE